MSSLLLLFIFVPVLTGILLALNLLLAVHRPDSEKVQAYECGFSPIYGQTRAPFHVQFYLVGILFLIFDLEILLVYPICVALYQVSFYGFWIVMVFFAILTVGFVLEIGSGALYFSEQKTSVSDLRPQIDSSHTPLPKFGQINHGVAGSRLIHTKAGLIDKPSHDNSTVSHARRRRGISEGDTQCMATLNRSGVYFLV